MVLEYKVILRHRKKQPAQKRKLDYIWRDYITRQRIGAAVCVIGITSAAISAKNFANRLMDNCEDFGQERNVVIETAGTLGDYEAIHQRVDQNTRTLESNAYLTIAGLSMAGLGYTIAR